MTIKRVGGLVFWRVGRLGGSCYLAKTKRNQGMTNAYLRRRINPLQRSRWPHTMTGE